MKKAAEGGELDAEGSPSQFPLHEEEEPSAEIVGGEVRPGTEGRVAGAEGAEGLGVVF